MSDEIRMILVILVAGVVLLSPVACTMRKQELIAEAIRQGADPIAVRCALEDSMNSTPHMCLVKAAKN